MKNPYHLLFFVLFYSFGFSQSNDCQLRTSKYNDIKTVDKEDIICLAKNSSKKNIIIHPFGIWCGPCITNLPIAKDLVNNYDVDVYILLILKEEHKRISKSMAFIRENYPEFKIIVLKDATYGNKNRKWNKHNQFIQDIIPSHLNNKVFSVGDYIVLDKTGEVILSTSYDDRLKEEGLNDEEMVNRLVKPVLTKHQHNNSIENENVGVK